jgi:hypothetical protein
MASTALRWSRLSPRDPGNGVIAGEGKAIWDFERVRAYPLFDSAQTCIILQRSPLTISAHQRRPHDDGIPRCESSARWVTVLPCDKWMKSPLFMGLTGTIQRGKLPVSGCHPARDFRLRWHAQVRPRHGELPSACGNGSPCQPLGIPFRSGQGRRARCPSRSRRKSWNCLPLVRIAPPPSSLFRSTALRSSRNKPCASRSQRIRTSRVAPSSLRYSGCDA